MIDLKSLSALGAIAALAIALSAGGAAAQTKVEQAIYTDLVKHEKVRVIVITRPRPGETGAAAMAAVSNPAGYLSGTLGASAIHIRAIGGQNAISAEVSAEAVERLRDDPSVALVTRDIPSPPTLFDSVPLIGADKLHKSGVKGSTWNVAVLDTGIDTSHPAFANSVQGEACFSTNSSQQYKVRSLCPDRLEESIVTGSAGLCPKGVPMCDHGTHVAGIIGGHGMREADKSFGGVAPGAGIVAVQVFTLFEDPDYCGAGVPQCLASFTSDQKRALDWIYRRRDQLKIAAINMSLGSGFHEEACDGISALTPVIEQLRARNIPTVIAAGNERFFDALAEPACISFAVSVSALDKKKELDVSYSNVSKRVTLAAPGSNIVSAVYDGKLGKKSGTSMAAPHVAATFALLREQNPQQSIKMMLDQMLASGSRATDRRTDTTVARLDLSGAATVAVSEGSGALSKPAEVPWGALPLADSNAGTTRGIAPPREAAPPLSSGATKVSEQKPVEPPSHSYIIKTTKPPAEVKAALENCAGGITCDVRQIGTDAYKVDVKPLPAAPPAPDRAAIEKMIGGDAKVYDNRLSKPLQ